MISNTASQQFLPRAQIRLGNRAAPKHFYLLKKQKAFFILLFSQNMGSQSTILPSWQFSFYSWKSFLIKYKKNWDKCSLITEQLRVLVLPFATWVGENQQETRAQHTI